MEEARECVDLFRGDGLAESGHGVAAVRNLGVDSLGLEAATDTAEVGTFVSARPADLMALSATPEFEEGWAIGNGRRWGVWGLGRILRRSRLLNLAIAESVR